MGIKTLRVYLVCFFLLGVVYPFFLSLVAKVFFVSSFEGSWVKNQKGEVVGSRLVGQNFSQDQYFWPRPSANHYQGTAKATQLGPLSPILKEQIEKRKAAGFKEEMLFASASGYDPHISPSSAKMQVKRISQVRKISEEEVFKVIDQNTEPAWLDLYGNFRVNVLTANLALDALKK